MANQFALPPSDRRKQRELEAARANRPTPKSIKVPPVPDPVGLPSKMITEGGTTAFEGLGLPTWLAEKVAEAYKTGVGYLPFVGRGIAVADELSKTPEQRLADLGSEEISPTDVNVKHPGDTTPRAAIMIGTGASSFPSLFSKPAAEDLSRGRAAKDVWHDWGIEHDAAGKQVSEIADNKAKITDVNAKTLEEGFHHPTLFENYPAAGQTGFAATNVEKHPYTGEDQYGGGYYKPGEAGAGPEGRIRATSSIADQKDPHSLRGLTVHESQHKVQQLEDMPRGGSPSEQNMYPLGEQLQKRAKKELAEAKRNGDEMDPTRQAQLERIAATTKDKFAALGYKSLAGEAQARNAAGRMDMSPQERRANPPSSTEDMPRDYQTVRPQSDQRVVMSEGPLSAEMGDRDKLRNELAGVAAPAVHTKGNEPLIQQIYKTAAENLPENIYKPATEPVFKVGGDPAALTKELVPQVSRADELTPNLPGRSGYPRGGRIQQIVDNEDRIAAEIARNLGQGGGNIPFYSTGPVLQGLVDQGVLSLAQAHQFMRDWAGQGAATSMRTETPQNLRNSSYLLFRRAQGDPLTPERQAEEAAGGAWGTYKSGKENKPRLNRPGFQMLEEHTKRADEMANNTVDAWKNSKPFMFREAWSGNMADVTADTHNIRSILSVYDRLFPGSLHRGWFENEDAFKRYQAGGGFTPDFPSSGGQGPGTQLPIGDIKDALPQPAIPGTGREGQIEYPLISNVTRKAGDILGVSPSEAQERMWFHYGPRTGLQSPPSTIPDLLNSQIEATARATGQTPEAIMRLWAKRGIPLAQNETTPVQGTSMVG